MSQAACDWLVSEIMTRLLRSAVYFSLFFVHEYPVNDKDKSFRKIRARAAKKVFIVIFKTAYILEGDMWCFISEPNGIIHEIFLAKNAVGQECLDKVRNYARNILMEHNEYSQGTCMLVVFFSQCPSL